MRLKRLLRINCVQSFLSYLIFLYISLVRYTSKWIVINSKSSNQLVLQGPMINAFWHGRMVVMPYLCEKKSKVSILISNHKDGQIIAKVMKIFGFKVIEGSTNNNSFRSLKLIYRKLMDGETIAITPDGPRGPVRKINSAMLNIAYKTKSPIVLSSFIAKRGFCFKSWDKFFLPYPFNKIIIIASSPYYIESEKAGYIQDMRTFLENELNMLEQRAQLYI